MSVADKVKSFLKIKGKDTAELAEYLKISKQALSNKYYRDSFSAEDLIKIANFLKCNMAFIDNTDRINFDINDIRLVSKNGKISSKTQNRFGV
jgi:transcriptional regulator with XRE-family HTH domain